jgi:hypothetical protein
MSFQVAAQPLPVRVNGATLKNEGPATLYYRDEAPVSSSANDGSLASGSSTTLTGTQYLAAATLTSVTLSPATPDPTPAGGFMMFSVNTVPRPILAAGYVVNVGSGTIYYRDRFPVSSTENDGSLSAGSRVPLSGTVWLSGSGTAQMVPSSSTALSALPMATATMVPTGAWTWFVDPRAVYDSTSGKLFVGSVLSAGSPAVATYDPATRKVLFTILKTDLELDDHDNPSLIVLPDGRIRAFYCRHAINGDPLYTRVTTNPGDATAWDAETQITSNLAGTNGFSYPKPYRLSAESNRIYLFFRSASFAQAYITSDDNGATWSAATALFTNGTDRPYFQVASNGTDTIHFTCTDGHPREVTHNNLYHFYYRAGNLYKSDGTLIGAISSGTTPAGVTKLYDDATSGKAWGWDLIVDSSGYPRLVYAAFVTDTDHRYRYARWTGSAWQDAQITDGGADIHVDPGGGASGEVQYSGGVAINPSRTDAVYISRQISTNQWNVERWLTTNDGLTFAKDGDVSTGSTAKNVRPYVPRGLPSSVAEVLWLQGDNGDKDGGYSGFTNYKLRVVLGPAPAVVDPPAPLLEEHFTGTDGITLQSHTADSGHTWTKHTTATVDVTFRFSRGYIASSGNGLYFSSAVPSSAEYAVEAVLESEGTNATATGGPSGRMDTVAQTHYHARWSFVTGLWELYKFTAGTAVLLDSSALMPFTGAPRFVRLELKDAAKKLFVDGVQLCTSADNTITAVGRPGLRFSGASNDAGVHMGQLMARLTV